MIVLDFLDTTAQESKNKRNGINMDYTHVDESGLYRGGYKAKIGVAKAVVKDYKGVVTHLREENYIRATYLKKSYSALCMTWTHIQKHVNTPMLEGIFPSSVVDSALITSGTPEQHADGIIGVSIALLEAVKAIVKVEAEIESEITGLKEEMFDAVTAEPALAASPILRSYDLLVAALEDLKTDPSPPKTPSYVTSQDQWRLPQEGEESDSDEHQSPVSVPTSPEGAKSFSVVGPSGTGNSTSSKKKETRHQKTDTKSGKSARK